MRCINNSRHSWKIEYGIPKTEGINIASIEKHECRKCGLIQYKTRKDIV